MTFKQLQDEAILLRFNETKRASVKSWLNSGYAATWDAADWHFKHVLDASLALTANDRTPTMPSDFAKVEDLYDDQGSPLAYLTPDVFREQFTLTTDSGRPWAYTVVDREVVLGPTPNATYGFKFSYLRRLSKIDGGTGLVAPGILIADADQPIWGAEHDYLLVFEAIILGASLEADPNVPGYQAQRDRLLDQMKNDLVRSTFGIPLQFG